jgi:hypothetical protein
MARFVSLLGLLILIGCETEPILFDTGYHVRFTETSLSIKESYSPIINIEVHNAGPALDTETTITYSISGSAREGVDYEIVGTRGRVVIDDGEFVGNIQVKLINNANNIIRTQDLVLTLISVSTADLRVGQSEGGIGKTFTLTIVDDCLLGGSFAGTRSVFSIPVEGISVTSSDCENYTLSKWNIELPSRLHTPFDVSLKFIDNGDNTLTIPIQDPDFDSDVTSLEGIGSVDPITREIFLVINLNGALGNPWYEVKLTLTPE